MNCYRVLSGQCLCLICSDMMTSCLDPGHRVALSAVDVLCHGYVHRRPPGPHYACPAHSNTKAWVVVSGRVLDVMLTASLWCPLVTWVVVVDSALSSACFGCPGLRSSWWPQCHMASP